MKQEGNSGAAISMLHDSAADLQIYLCSLQKASFFFLTSFIFIAPAYNRLRYRNPNFRLSVHLFVCPFVHLSTFTSKFAFLDIRHSCDSKTLHSNCP